MAALRLSRATIRKIKQNLFWAFVYNTLGLPLAALGYLSPILAGAATALSSVSVTTNATLLKRLIRWPALTRRRLWAGRGPRPPRPGVAAGRHRQGRTSRAWR